MDLGELLDPSLDRRGGDAQQLGRAVHRQAADVEQHRRHLHRQGLARPRGVGEVQPARLAAVTLLAAHEAVLDVLLAPAFLASQSHHASPAISSMPEKIGRLCSAKTLQAKAAYAAEEHPEGATRIKSVINRKLKGQPAEVSFD